MKNLFRVLLDFLRDPVRLLSAIIRKVVPGSQLGLEWRRAGNFITFTERGFVAGSTPPLLLARHNYEVEYIRKVLQGRRFQRSLEIGCGYGRLSPVFRKYAQTHIAIDINQDALRNARNCYPALTFVGGSTTALPFRDECFDLVVAWTVLQHVPPQTIGLALTELRRVVRPEGRFLLCEETRDTESISRHVWGRDVDFYRAGFKASSLEFSEDILEIGRMSGLEEPGHFMIMLFAH